MLTVIPWAVSEQVQNDVLAAITAKNFSWYYQPGANYNEGPLKEKVCKESGAIDTFQLAHMMYENGEARSPVYRELLPVIAALPGIKELLKVKVNLTVKNSAIGPGQYCVPHVDQTVPGGMTAVYYPHDSTGDTVVFNEQWPADPMAYDFSKLTVAKSIKPKKGTLVVFPSGQIHAGNCPQEDEPRIVVNFNFVAH